MVKSPDSKRLKVFSPASDVSSPLDGGGWVAAGYPPGHSSAPPPLLLGGGGGGVLLLMIPPHPSGSPCVEVKLFSSWLLGSGFESGYGGQRSQRLAGQHVSQPDHALFSITTHSRRAPSPPLRSVGGRMHGWQPAWSRRFAPASDPIKGWQAATVIITSYYQGLPSSHGPSPASRKTYTGEGSHRVQRGPLVGSCPAVHSPVSFPPFSIGGIPPLPCK